MDTDRDEDADTDRGVNADTDHEVKALRPLIRDEEADGSNTVSREETWLSKCPLTGYTHVMSVMDSGAADSCAPQSMCPLVDSVPSEGSRRGLMYTAAGGARIPNQGEKHLDLVTLEDVPVQTAWQTVDINRQLSSVRQICLQGNLVIFGAHGGVIMSLETGRETHFRIEDNVYVLDLRRPPSANFVRQG